MGIIRQIKMEIRNILKSRFLFIMAVLIVAVGVAVPVIGILTARQNSGGIIEPTYRPMPVYAEDLPAYRGDDGMIKPDPGPDNRESITINGVTIYVDNPSYWNLVSMVSEKQQMELNPGRFENPAAMDLTIALIDREIEYHLIFAQYISNWQDYRQELSWQGMDSVYDLFFLENREADIKVLTEVAMYRRGLDEETLKRTYIDITAEQRLEKMDRAEENLAMLTDIVVNNNFPKYIALRVKMLEDQIQSIRENIAIQEQIISENPSQEEQLAPYIEQLKKEILLIETNTIPLLQYRLEKNIIPGLQIWQNSAISDIENSRNQLSYLLPIMTEEEFNERRGGDGGWIMEKAYDSYSYSYSSFYPYPVENDTYEEYVASTQRQVDALNLVMIVAQKSLDTDEPDMKYVPTGSRSRTVGFLSYSMIVALFGVLLGGWLIASEYQQGTIRLLMIRPKTRSKILLAKFLAAVVVWLAVDLLSSLLNMITNGIAFGFADFAFPNYTVDGQVGFLAFFIPRFLACILPILFTFAIAFMLSVIVKNIAVAIAVPIVFYIGSFILMNIAVYAPGMNWVFWTPIPFLQMGSLFSPNSSFQYMIQQGMNINIPYGVTLLLVLSVAFTAITLAVFKKRDIVN